MSKYRSEPKLKVVAMETDKGSCQEAADMCQEQNLTWVDLRAFADKVSTECADEDTSTDSEERLVGFQFLCNCRQFGAGNAVSFCFADFGVYIAGNLLALCEGLSQLSRLIFASQI